MKSKLLERSTQSVGAEKLWEWLDQGKATVIDVREPEDFGTAHHVTRHGDLRGSCDHWGRCSVANDAVRPGPALIRFRSLLRGAPGPWNAD